MARGIELLTAYVSLAVSAQGIGSQVARDFAQVDRIAADTGRRAGRALADGVGSAKPNLAGLQSEVQKAARTVDAASKEMAASMHRQEQATKLVEQRTKELETATQKYGAGSSQVMAKERALSDARYKLSTESQKTVAAQKSLEQAQDKSKASTTALTAAEKNLGAESGKTAGHMSRLGKAIADVKSDELAEKFRRVDWNGMQRGATVVAAGIAGAFGGAVKTAADFEQRMSAVKAVSGATVPQLQQLHDKALQLGKDTAFSASESATALEELVKAGLTIPQVMGGAADATVALAAASGVDMPEAATIASNAMNAFRIEGSKMGHVADVIAGAANASAIDVKEFGYSLQMSGAVANLAGMNFDDLAVAIAEMGNAGIKGSDAGTSLKTMLNNLQPTSNAAYNQMRELGLISFDTQQAMQKLGQLGVKPLGSDYNSVRQAISDYLAKTRGIKNDTKEMGKAVDEFMIKNGGLKNQFYDQAGNLKSLRDMQGSLSEATKNLTKEQRQQALETMFGSDAIRAAAVMAQNGAAGFDDLSGAMGKVTAAQTAADRMGNLKGQMEQMKGSVETLAITLGEKLIPPMNRAVKAVTDLINKFLEMPADEQQKWVGIAAAVGGLAGSLALAIGAVKGVIAINNAVIAFNALRTAIAASTAATWLMNAAQRAMPIMMIVTGIAALVAGLVLLYQRNETFRNAVNGAWNGIKAAIGAVWNWLSGTLWPGIVSVWNAISGGAQTMGSGITGVWTTITGALQAAWNWVSGVFLAGWQLLGTWLIFPLLNFAVKVGQWWAGVSAFIMSWAGWIGSVFAAAWGVIQIILLAPVRLAEIAIRAVWEGIKWAFMAAWNWVSGVFMGFWRTLEPLVRDVMERMWRGIQNVWNAIIFVFTVAWNWVSGVFRGWWNTLAAFVTDEMDRMRRGAQRIWDAVTAIFAAAWNWVSGVFMGWWRGLTGMMEGPIDAAKRSIDRILDGIKHAFRVAVDAIRDLWSGIKEAVRAPIVIAVKIGNSLVDGFNAIAKFLLIKEAPRIADVPAFQSGGVIPGTYDAANRDNVLAMTGAGMPIARVEPGEYVINRASTDRYAPLLDAINAGALPGYAGGGRVHPVPGFGVNWSRGYHGADRGLDIPAPTGTPVVAMRDATVNSTARWGYSYGHHIRLSDGSIYAHLSAINVAPGQQVKAGQTIGAVGSTGKSTGPHLHVTAYDGASPIGKMINGAMGAVQQITDWVGDLGSKFAGPLKRIKEMGSTGIGALAGGLPGKLASGFTDKIKSAAASISDSIAPSGVGPDAAGSIMGPLLRMAKGMGLPRQVALIAGITAMQEASGRLDFTPDRNSDVGIFQQRTPRDGTIAQLNDLGYAFNVFLRGTRARPGNGDGGGYHVPGLFDKNWQRMSPGAAAQAVQVSDFPYAYDKHIPTVTRMLDAIGYRIGTTSATRGLHMVHEGELITSPNVRMFEGGERVHTKESVARMFGKPKDASPTYVFQPRYEAPRSVERDMQDFLYEIKKASR